MDCLVRGFLIPFLQDVRIGLRGRGHRRGEGIVHALRFLASCRPHHGVNRGLDEFDSVFHRLDFPGDGILFRLEGLDFVFLRLQPTTEVVQTFPVQQVGDDGFLAFQFFSRFRDFAIVFDV